MTPEQHKAIREALKRSGYVLNLSGATLPTFNLSGADLSGANFAGTNFRRGNFRDTILKGAILKGTDFRGADLTGAQGLTREQIGEAIIDETTILPDYLRKRS